MIRLSETSRGLLVFAVPGGWGDWYQVALFDKNLAEVAAEEDELHEEGDLAASLVAVGIPQDEARSLAARLVPDSPQPRKRRGWLRGSRGKQQ